MSALSTVARSVSAPTATHLSHNTANATDKKNKLGFVRRTIDVITTLLLCVSMSTAIMRVLPLGESFPRVGIEAVLNWFLLFALLQLAVQLLLKHRVRALLAGLVCTFGAYFVPGLIPKAQPQHTTETLTAFSTNLYGSSTNHTGIREELRESAADVVSLQELTPEWVISLAPVLQAYPHQIFAPRECCHGIGFASKYPIVHHEIVDIGNGIPAIRATLDVHGRLVDVWSVHTLPPNQARYTGLWVEQTDRLIHHFRNRERTTIAMGDFNASPTSRTYHRLIELSHLDGAHERLGRGYATTWPNGTLPLPPIRLDHMLVSQDVAVRSMHEGVGEGSDHRPLTALLAF